MTQRKIIETLTAQPNAEGAGDAIHRVSGMQHIGMDPILMIDEFRAEHTDEPGRGFPPHPHRGMQTLTYMKQGGIIHEDSLGNHGKISNGGAQWMSAGRGIIHSEVPTQSEQGLHGFQLWINLLASEKLSEPRYRDVNTEDLGHWLGKGAEAVIISGQWQLDGDMLEGPLKELANYVAIMDLSLAPGIQIEIPISTEENLIGYVYSGRVELQGSKIIERQMLITGEGDELAFTAGESGANLLLMRGLPLREPVVHYGPFVMNTNKEIESTLRDYQSGRFP